MQHCLWIWSLLMTSITAQGLALPASGLGKPGFAIRDNGLRLLRTAGLTANITDSIAFNRTYNGTEEEWTWRINITDIAVPNNPFSFGFEDTSFSDGLRVANTQWQLVWGSPGHSTLDSLARSRDATIRFSFLISNKPSSILEEYSSDDGGDCAPILGEECTESLKRAASGGPVVFTGLAGCDDILVTNDGGRDDGLALTYEPPSPRDNEFDLFSRRESLFYRTSQPYTASNLTEYSRSVSALHVFIMDWAYNSNLRLGEMGGPTVLCRVLDATAQEDLQTNETNESEESDGEEDEDDDGGAAVLSQPSVLMWLFLVLSVMVMT